MDHGLEVLAEIKENFVESIINIKCALDVFFIPGSFIREYAKSEHLQKDRSNYHFAVGAEIARTVLYVSTASWVYYLKG